MTPRRRGEQPQEGFGEGAALWAVLVGRLTDRLAHEIRNPLNGAMVNLQVVASRAERSGADAAALTPFARAATAELERAAALVEGLLRTLRPPGAEEDVATALRSLGELYAAAAHRSGGTLRVEGEPYATGPVAVAPLAVRVALALALEEATADGGESVATVISDHSGVTVRIARREGLRAPDEGSLALLARAGIAANSASSEYILHFPARAG